MNELSLHALQCDECSSAIDRMSIPDLCDTGFDLLWSRNRCRIPRLLYNLICRERFR